MATDRRRDAATAVTGAGLLAAGGAVRHAGITRALAGKLGRAVVDADYPRVHAAALRGSDKRAKAMYAGGAALGLAGAAGLTAGTVNLVRPQQRKSTTSKADRPLLREGLSGTAEAVRERGKVERDVPLSVRAAQLSVAGGAAFGGGALARRALKTRGGKVKAAAAAVAGASAATTALPVTNAAVRGRSRGEYVATATGVRRAKAPIKMPSTQATMVTSRGGPLRAQVVPSDERFAEFGKAAPKRLGFLHPKARTYDLQSGAARMAGNKRIGELASGGWQDKFKAGFAAKPGPSAPPKVLRSLSGKDYGDTLSRLGRATRHQDREFGAAVHPISGRVMAMNRGGPGTTGLPVAAAYDRKSIRGMARLADDAKNPAVRARAEANLKGENKNIAGPTPRLVHTHPTYGKGKHDRRHYPSAPDLGVAHQMPGEFRHVVLSGRDAPRGGKKTVAVTTRQYTRRGEELTGPEAGARRMDTLMGASTHDQATLSTPLARGATRSAKPAEVQSVFANRKEARKVTVHRSSNGKLKTHDNALRSLTGTRRAAEESGFYTTTSLHKADYLGRQTSYAQQRATVTASGGVPGIGPLVQAGAAGRYAPPGQERKHAIRQHAMGPTAGLAAGVGAAVAGARHVNRNPEGKVAAGAQRVIDAKDSAGDYVTRRAINPVKNRMGIYTGEGPRKAPGTLGRARAALGQRAGKVLPAAVKTPKGRVAALAALATVKPVVGFTGGQTAITLNQRDQKAYNAKHPLKKFDVGGRKQQKRERISLATKKRISAGLSAVGGTAGVGSVGLLLAGKTAPATKLGIVGGGFGGGNALLNVPIQRAEARQLHKAWAPAGGSGLGQGVNAWDKRVLAARRRLGTPPPPKPPVKKVFRSRRLNIVSAPRTKEILISERNYPTKQVWGIRKTPILIRPNAGRGDPGHRMKANGRNKRRYAFPEDLYGDTQMRVWGDPMSKADGGEHKQLLRQYGDRGPLPKKLDRDTRMKAYEARYAAHGGHKGERWQRAADVSEGTRNVGLAGATLGGMVHLGAKTKRGGKVLGAARATSWKRRGDTAAIASATLGGAAELSGEYSRSRRASYASSPGGVAASALTRMRANTPGGKS